MKQILFSLALAILLVSGASGQISYAGDVAFLGAAETTSTVVLSGAIAEAAPVSYVTATYTSEMAGENNDIVFTAVPGATWGGALGNSIDIILVDPGEDTGACSVEADPSTGDVSVTLSYGAGAINATAQDVMDCIAANATAAAMVTCANASEDTGAGTVTALSSQDLSGGVNGTAGTTGQLVYYSGDLFYLVSGSEFYDATWAQWDGGDTDGSVSSARSITTTGTMTAEQLTSTDDGTIAGALAVGEGLTVTGTITNAGFQALEARTYLHVQTITNPAVAAADTIAGATTVDEAGFTLAAVDLDAQPDVARTLSVTPADELTAWVLFEGTNIDDEAITEYVNFSASSAAASTTKAFKTLTGVSGAKTAGTDRTITIGQTDELGLDMTIDNDHQIMVVKFDGGIDATQTLTKDSTDVELNNIDIAGTLDGTKTVWVYVLVEAS